MQKTTCMILNLMRPQSGGRVGCLVWLTDHGLSAGKGRKGMAALLIGKTGQMGVTCVFCGAPWTSKWPNHLQRPQKAQWWWQRRSSQLWEGHRWQCASVGSMHTLYTHRQRKKRFSESKLCPKRMEEHCSSILII